ncbi:hypothetical protein KHU50_012545 [Colletotrichum sp. SAR 10_65]|nr:hypothetical protein KHU50_012545 [Colletotrichum sp. SAR 10_65]
MELRPNHQFNPFASDDELAQYDLPDLPADFDKMDFKDPATLSKLLGMPVPHKTPAEVRKDAESLSSSLLASYDHLRAIAARHEPGIHHRWLRKKRHQRLDTLTRVWGPGVAAEKLYGSAWQFRWTDGDQSRIQFHEPHPYSKIPFVVARRIGRRLNRNYGWTGDIFVLKGTE